MFRIHRSHKYVCIDKIFFYKYTISQMLWLTIESSDHLDLGEYIGGNTHWCTLYTVYCTLYLK